VNWQASAGTELLIPAEKTGQQQGTAASEMTGGPEGDWLCAWCLNRVANEKDRFSYNGKNEFGFSNPEGIHFEIITFSQTVGCRQHGPPTFDDTWFPDHAWSFCHCSECEQHLGWYYSGEHEFAGLIKPRIVRALYLRN
jgi:hypothetical protein